MQFAVINIFSFITSCFIITNVCGIDDKVVERLVKRSAKYSSGYHTANFDYKVRSRNGGEFNSRFSNGLTIMIQDEREHLNIELEKVDHYLANEHLPIWKSSSEYAQQYYKLPNVMRDVGEFTMYRHYATYSALVHFHARDELDGVIHRRYYIRKLPRSKLHQVHKVNDKYVFIQGHPFYPIDDELTESEEEKSKELSGNETNVRVSRGTVPQVYPEFLVAISFDMFTAIESRSRSPFAVNTVSHVLVIFNAVDMLYHSVKSARININIAGIVIEASQDHWGFEASLAVGEIIEHGSRVRLILDATNISQEISDYFKEREYFFPRDSYDFIIYNTRNQLTYSSVNVMGMAWHSGFSCMYPVGQTYDRINLAAQDHKSYAHYVVLAHEIAHMMNVQHDPIDKTVKNGTTHDSIMLCYNSQCVHGLSWSKASEKTFKLYFNSPASCILRNYPRSRHPPNPRKTISASEQCKCLGFDTFRKPDPGDECDEPIVCLDNANKDLLHVTQLPMDGTPCKYHLQNFVCWKGECVDSDN